MTEQAGSSGVLDREVRRQLDHSTTWASQQSVSAAWSISSSSRHALVASERIEASGARRRCGDAQSRSLGSCFAFWSIGQIGQSTKERRLRVGLSSRSIDFAKQPEQSTQVGNGDAGQWREQEHAG